MYIVDVNTKMNSDLRFLSNCFKDFDGSMADVDEEKSSQKDCETLKETIVNLFDHWERNFMVNPKDVSVYTGAAGGALLYLQLFEKNFAHCLGTTNEALLQKANSIIKQCLKHDRKNRFSFLCGQSGILALKAYINFLANKAYEPYLKELASLASRINDPEIPDEVLYGRSGFLYALLFIRSKIVDSYEIIYDDLIRSTVNSILQSGQECAQRENSDVPLVYYWHQKGYVGAAHGYAGILYMLLEANNYLTQEDLTNLVKPTLDFVLQSTRFEKTGNFRSSLTNSEDRLVHWCHGSPGLIHLLVLAHKYFGDSKYLDAAIQASEDLWQRGILKKGKKL